MLIYKMANPSVQYDYLVAGGGLSGLTMALKIQEKLPRCSVLIIDKDAKVHNDRTWSFWTKKNGLVPDIAAKHWKKIRVAGRDFDETLSIAPYEYRTIRGIDFYKYAKSQLSKSANIHFLQTEIETLDESKGIITTKSGESFQGKLIFKSFFNPRQLKIDTAYPILHQQFKGWIIRTEKPAFDDTTATMMDFDVPGPPTKDLRFFYILPFSPTEALVEFTIFARKKETEEGFDEKLSHYIDQKLNIQNFTIKETEFNSIPMTNFPFHPKVNGKVVNIGTIGGFIKPSSGYAFMRTFEKTEQIVNQLLRQNHVSPHSFTSPYHFRLFDSIILNLLYNYRIPPVQIFKKLYTNIPPSVLFKFLDEKANLIDIMRVMLISPQKHKFWNAFFKLLFSRHKF